MRKLRAPFALTRLDLADAPPQSLAFGLGLLALVPLALESSRPRAPLHGYSCAAYIALLDGHTPPAPPGAGGAAHSPLSVRATATLYALSVAPTLAGAAIFAGVAPDHRGAGFVAAGAVVAADAAGALAWRGGLLLHRSPGPFLAAAGLARGALLLFSVKNWFLGHALLYAVIASAFAAAAAARRWPLRTTESKRAEQLADTLEKLKPLARANTQRLLAEAAAAAPAEAAPEEEAQAPRMSSMEAMRRMAQAAMPTSVKELRERLWWVLGRRTGLWAALTVAFAAELGVVAARQPTDVPGVNAAHPQWQFGVAAMLCPPAACAALAFWRAWAALPPNPPEAEPLAHAASADVAADPPQPSDEEAPAAAAAPGCVSSVGGCVAATKTTAAATVGWFWTGKIGEDAAAALKHAVFGAATFTGAGIALGAASGSSIVLAGGVCGPLLAASAAAAARDWPTSAYRTADPRRWSQRQRRSALWLLLNVAALGMAAGIVAGDGFRRNSTGGRHLRVSSSKTRYALPGYQSLAITLGAAFLELAAAAMVQLYRTLELRGSLLGPLGAGLLIVSAAWIGGSLAITRAPQLSASPGAPRRSPNAAADIGIALVPALAAPGLVLFGAGLMLWRDAADWAARPPRAVLACLASGHALCAAAGALIIATLAPVLGGGLLAAVVAAAGGCLARAAWAANGRSLPGSAWRAGTAAAAVAAALGLAAGFVSEQPFRGFSVAWLLTLALAGAHAARPLIAATRVVFAPSLLPAAIWDDAAAAPRFLNRNVWALLAIALGVFCWGALCAINVMPASGGAAAAVGAAAVAGLVAAATAHASEAKAAEALAALSPDAVARALAGAAAAVGLLTPEPQAAGGLPPAGSATDAAPGLASGCTRVRLSDAWATQEHPLPDAAQLAAVKEAQAALGLKMSCFAPSSGPSDALGAERAEAASALLAAHAAAGAASDRYGAFAAALAHLVRMTADAERSSADALLRAFLLEHLGFSATPAEVAAWTPAQREAVEAARGAWVARRSAAALEEAKRAEEEAEGRRRRAAAAAAALAAAKRLASAGEEEARLRREREAAEAAARFKAAEAARLAAEEAARKALADAEAETERIAREEDEARHAAVLAEEEHRRREAEAAEEARRAADAAEDAAARFEAEEAARKAAEAAAEARRVADEKAEETRRRKAAELEEAERRRKAAEDAAAASDVNDADRIRRDAESARIARAADEARRTEEQRKAAADAAAEVARANAAAEAERKRKSLAAAKRAREAREAREAAARDAAARAAAEAARLAAARAAAKKAAEDAARAAAAAAEAARKKAAEEKAERDRLARELEAKRALDEAAALGGGSSADAGLAACEAAAKALRDATVGKGPFCDASFPANATALYDNGTSRKEGEDAFPVREWRRAKALRGAASQQRVLFAGGAADPDRVQQGALGDCWLISALAVLGAAGRVPALFMTRDVSEEGAYCLRLYRGGAWTPVIVDDRLPVQADGSPAFARSRNAGELWIPLLEKAFAKHYGAYENLDGGYVADALVDMTGGAGEVVKFSDEKTALAAASGELWAKLRAAAAPQAAASAGNGDAALQPALALLGCGSHAGKDTTSSSAGIVQGHAYSILELLEADGVKLLKLRNPWGSGVEWKGAWADGAPEWTPRMRKRLGYAPKDGDGVFYMQWEDFQQHYATIYLCRVFPPHAAHQLAGRWDAHTAGGPFWGSGARCCLCCVHARADVRYAGTTYHKNPRFSLRRRDGASRPTSAYLTLTQVWDSAGDDAHDREKDTSAAIRIDVFRETGERFASWSTMDQGRVDKQRVGGNGVYAYTRQVSAELTLPACAEGWLLVPSTFAAGQQAAFILAVYTTEAVELKPRA